MPVIAIETATLAGSIAIVDDKGIVAELALNIRATHSEKIMTAMDYLFKNAGMTLDEMDGIAVSRGPGSFTGLRIGLNTAKGLSYASGKPMICIPTLNALALNILFSEHLVCPILDARKGEVYAALYRPAGQYMEKLTDEMAVKPEKLSEMIKERTVFLGDGVNTYGGVMRERLKGLYCEAPMPLRMPRASNVATLALERLAKGDSDDPFTVVPGYIRKSEAELKWKGL